MESQQVQPPPELLRSICRHWSPLAVEAIRSLDRAGWSGAPAHAVTVGGRGFVLKRCGTVLSRVRAAWIHAVMLHCRSAGVAIVPDVMRGIDGSTLHEDPEGHLWELLDHMPGTACDSPTAAQREAAAEALAAVHAAAATFAEAPPRLAESPGLAQRRTQATALLARPWHTWPAHAASGPLPARLRRAADVVATHDGRRALEHVARFDPGPVRVQPVLRDVWAEHVLFVGDRVTAIIDWHAAGIDTPATDIARLTGSWPAARAQRTAFIQAYARVRPLGAVERSLVGFLDAAGVVCAIDNWLRWTLEEQRSFADMDRVLQRIDLLVGRLPEALAEITHSAETSLDSATNVD